MADGETAHPSCGMTEEEFTRFIEVLDDSFFDLAEGEVLEIAEAEVCVVAYSALCQGFGFRPEAVPDPDVVDNHLWNDVIENETGGQAKIVKEMDAESDEYWKINLRRDVLKRIVDYWYTLGRDYREEGLGFPYTEDVSAKVYMAMSDEEKRQLQE